ncbi:hypothetical protein [Actinophytocola sp. KF-1]
MISKRIKAAASAVTVAGAVVAAIVVPATNAVAYNSGGLVLDVMVQSPGQLLARGAAVSVPVSYTCSGASQYAALYVSVAQRVGGKASATGDGAVRTLTCTGEIQNVSVEVLASGGQAFTRGEAFVQARISDCYSVCGDEYDSRTVTFER